MGVSEKYLQRVYICLVALNSPVTSPLQNLKISLTISLQL
ncbi:hypothetical protein [Shigella phage ESh21]|nr:hypothetical protein [Shigella phage ESh21]